MQKKKICVISSLFVGFYTHQLLYKVLLIMYALKIYFSNIVNSHFFCWIICAHERKSGNPCYHLTWRSSTTKFVNGDTDWLLYSIHRHRRAISLSHADKDQTSIDLDGVTDSDRYTFLQNERERRKLSSSAVLCKTLQFTDNNQNKHKDFRCIQK